MLRGHGFSFQSSVEIGLGFSRRDVPNGFKQAAIIDPVPTHSRVAYSTASALRHGPRTGLDVDDFGLEQAIDRLGQSIVASVANAADQGLDACLGRPLSVFDRQLLRSAVRLMHRPHGIDRAAFTDQLFEGIRNETGMRECAGAPADAASGMGLDDESDKTASKAIAIRTATTMLQTTPGGLYGQLTSISARGSSLRTATDSPEGSALLITGLR